jgi:hypothetical protein
MNLKEAWKPAVGLIAGLLLALVAGGVMPRSTLNASATDRSESFAMATGPIDNGVEAVFTLDFLSGDLNGAVLNPGTRTFTVTYHRNLAADFKLEAGRSPKFMMVTGQAYLRTGSNYRLAPCAIYVTELTTGKMAAYTFPYNTSSTTRSEIVPVQEFILLQVVPIRTIPVRD